MAAIWKTTYRGYGVYWHGSHGYGDETRPYDPPCRSLPKARARIDATIEASRVPPTPAEAHWSGLSETLRRKYRADPRIWTHDEGAAGVAYMDFLAGVYGTD